MPGHLWLMGDWCGYGGVISQVTAGQLEITCNLGVGTENSVKLSIYTGNAGRLVRVVEMIIFCAVWPQAEILIQQFTSTTQKQHKFVSWQRKVCCWLSSVSSIGQSAANFTWFTRSNWITEVVFDGGGKLGVVLKVKFQQRHLRYFRQSANCGNWSESLIRHSIYPRNICQVLRCQKNCFSPGYHRCVSCMENQQLGRVTNLFESL